jgi:hypothetical protein
MNCKIELAFLFSLLYANKKIIVKRRDSESNCGAFAIIFGFKMDSFINMDIF